MEASTSQHEHFHRPAAGYWPCDDNPCTLQPKFFRQEMSAEGAYSRLVNERDRLRKALEKAHSELHKIQHYSKDAAVCYMASRAVTRAASALAKA